jgi:hypothetical protein
MLAGTACVGQTGGDAIDFPVAAAGPASAATGQPLSCANDGAWEITLTAASLHVGAVYLNQSQPVSGGQATGCYLTGTYVAQETSGVDVDLLSPTPQRFPALAHGITDPSALVGQVWLTHGDVNLATDRTPMLTVEGTAAQGGQSFPFSGTLTIGANHQSAGGTLAGGDPICKERIVTPIPAAVRIEPAGGLLLRIDPCRLFTNVDFSQLRAGQTTGTYTFSDDPQSVDYTQPSKNLYANLRNTGPYAFSWAPDL